MNGWRQKEFKLAHEHVRVDLDHLRIVSDELSHSGLATDPPVLLRHVVGPDLRIARKHGIGGGSWPWRVKVPVHPEPGFRGSGEAFEVDSWAVLARFWARLGGFRMSSTSGLN